MTSARRTSCNLVAGGYPLRSYEIFPPCQPCTKPCHKHLHCAVQTLSCNISSALGLFCLCVHAGHFLEDNMRHCQLTREKFNSEVRQKGYVSLSKVFAVTLEPPGKFSIFTKSELCSSCCLNLN